MVDGVSANIKEERACEQKLTNVPEDALLEIAKHLSPKELSRLKLVSGELKSNIQAQEAGYIANYMAVKKLYGNVERLINQPNSLEILAKNSRHYQGFTRARGYKTYLVQPLDPIHSLNKAGQFETGGWVGSSPTVIAEGVIAVGSRDRHVYVLNASSATVSLD